MILDFCSSDAGALELLLRRCTAPVQVHQIHAAIVVSGQIQRSQFLCARLISVYSYLNLLPSAVSLFLYSSSLAPPSSILCNSILRSLLSHSDHLRAIFLYRRSLSLGAIPDGFTFPLALRACACLSNPYLGLPVHAQAVAMGFGHHLHVSHELLSLYARIGRMDLARTVFDGFPARTVVTWNVLVSGYARNRQCDHARKVFDVMPVAGLRPNPVTWTSMLSAYARCQRHDDVIVAFDEMRACGCAATAEAVAVALSVCPYISADGLGKGKQMHGFAKRSGFEGFSFVRNSLVCMYGKLGHTMDSEILFSELEWKNLVSWNALISSYAASGCCGEAYEVFRRLREAAGEPEPDVVSWSAVIGSFASCGELENSVHIFRLMQRTSAAAGVQPNAVTIATVLSACAELLSLGSGREIHAHTIRSSMDGNILIQNALLNLYSKCGGFGYGCLLFKRMKCRDLISWNSMINLYGMHGACDEALRAFEGMIRSGVEPDGITFVAILSACSHSGRVDVGRRVFDSMVCEHGISPGMEHYSCMVDLLGRAGLIREASELIEKMPVKPNACVWGALLNSCRIHGIHTDMAEDAVSRILGIEEGMISTGNSALISSIYAAIGRWEESARVRVATRKSGVRKNPGQSWVEVKKRAVAFSAGGSLPSGAEGAYEVMENLSRQMESENQVSNDWLLLDFKLDEEGC